MDDTNNNNKNLMKSPKNLRHYLLKGGKFARNSFAFFGFMTLVSPLYLIYKWKQNEKKYLKLPDNITLQIDFSNDLMDVASPFLTSNMFGNSHDSYTLKEIREALYFAARDPRVKGIIGKFRGLGNGYNFAYAEEIREMLSGFHNKVNNNKITCAYADSFGEGGGEGTISYYLASSFQNIFVQPSGYVSITGLGISQPFVKDFLKKHHIKPYIFKREKYKGALDFMGESKFSEAQREAMEQLLHSINNKFINDISSIRSINKDSLIEYMNEARLGPEIAKENGLIDDYGYEDEFLDSLQSHVGIDSKIIKLSKYLEIMRRLRKKGQLNDIYFEDSRYDDNPFEILTEESDILKKQINKLHKKELKANNTNDDDNNNDNKNNKEEEEEEEALVKSKTMNVNISPEQNDEISKENNDNNDDNLDMNDELKKNIAVLYLNGEIVRDLPDNGDFDQTISAKHTVRALKVLRADPSVKGIVLRINSPGGSAIASDSIWREIILTRSKGIPVVCSMSGYAASGGYFMAAPCSRIFAKESTITGSIGVIMGKVTFHKFLKEYGINMDHIYTNKNSLTLSPFTDLSKEQIESINKEIDLVYHDFLSKVASGRKMSIEQVREIAQGRVWTGRDALDIGLVDEIGGLREAIQWCVKDAKLDLSDEDVKVIHVPQYASDFKMKIYSLFSSEDDCAIIAPEGESETIINEKALSATHASLKTEFPLNFNTFIDVLTFKSPMILLSNINNVLNAANTMNNIQGTYISLMKSLNIKTNNNDSIIETKTNVFVK